MAMQIVQIDYQLIDQLSQRCATQQSQIQAILHQLRQTIQALEHGGWQGDAATACFNQFDDEIVPAYTRLALVFAESQSVLKAIAKAFHEAEAEAAALFNAEHEALALQAKPINEQIPPEVIAQTVDQFLAWLRPQQSSLVIETIRLIPLGLRRFLLNQSMVREAIRALPGTLPQIIMASLLEGSLTWSQASLMLTTEGLFNDKAPAPNAMYPEREPPVDRNFAQLVNFLLADRNRPLSSFDMYGRTFLPQTYDQWNMNCWESVMYIGLLSGDLSLAQLDVMYTNVITKIDQASANGTDQLTAANQALAEGLGYNPEQIWSSGQIEAGSIVFFVSNGSPLNHVAMATGKMINGSPELISLWDRPNNTKSVQFTTIAELKGSDDTITYAPNPWLNDKQPSWYNIETIISS
ncbi:WXG100 family type VII secretion target [Herpetosiphon llansteffanensis]|uniref:WXG100 family type VII secretion target n=1 Tax=Herpetosiphon llansteffanensis TaxID=2094568 RepID=UPI000D7CD5BF|nr:WXG100 family type VII secretion target [Herpetosiphon llansteffanensis]